MDVIIQTIRDIDKSVEDLLNLRLSLIDLARFRTGDLLDIEIPRPVSRPYEMLTDDEIRKAIKIVEQRRRIDAVDADLPAPRMNRNEQHLRNEESLRALEIGREAGAFK